MVRLAIVAVLVLSSGPGARFLPGGDPVDFRAAQGSSAAVGMGLLSVVIAVALLWRVGQVSRVASALLGDLPHLLIIVLFLVGAAMYAVAADGLGLDAFEGFARYLASLAIGAACVVLLGLRGTLDAVRVATVLMSTVSVLLELISPELVRVGRSSDLYAGVFGWNSAAGYTAGLGLILSVYLPWRKVTGPMSLIAILTPALICAFVLWQSQSRTAQFATAAAIVFGLATFARRRRVQIASYFLAGAVLGAGLVRYATSVLEVSGKDGTLTGRSDIWRQAWSLIAERPMYGYGAGNAWGPGVQIRVLNTLARPESAHNGLLELLLAGGLLALVPLGMLLVRASSRGVARLADGRIRYPGLFPVLVLIVVLSVALSVLFRNGLVPIVFAAITAPTSLLAAPRRHPANDDDDRGRPYG